MPTSEPFYEHLPCQLTGQELVLKSKALAELLCDQANIELEKKEANADFKARLDSIDTKMASLAQEVRTGREYRDVACIERADWTDNRVEIVRTDTGEVVRIRPLQQGERQEALPYARSAAARADNDNGGADEFEREMQ